MLVCIATRLTEKDTAEGRYEIDSNQIPVGL